jgi:hypothetical protein
MECEASLKYVRSNPAFTLVKSCFTRGRHGVDPKLEWIFSTITDIRAGWRKMTYLYTVQSKARGASTVVSLLAPEEGFHKGLPPEAVVGTLPPNVNSVNQIDFKPNPAFVDFLHMVIRRYAPLSADLQNAAKRKHEGWMYIIDCRVPNPQGEVESEDVIGAFKIEAGLIVPDSYRRNNQHLLVSQRGLFCLDDWLKSKLLEETRSLLSHS